VVAEFDSLPTAKPVPGAGQNRGSATMKTHNLKRIKSLVLCKNCLHKKDKAGDDHLSIYTKEEWICLGFGIIDLLDGSMSYYSCRKARRELTLCGVDGQWFKARP
jgi:hypothetical protein